MTDQQRSERESFEKVDVPVVVPPEMAEDMVDDLEETGSINVTITTDHSPHIIDQLRWQLENEQNALEFVGGYDGE